MQKKFKGKIKQWKRGNCNYKLISFFIYTTLLFFFIFFYFLPTTLLSGNGSSAGNNVLLHFPLLKGVHYTAGNKVTLFHTRKTLFPARETLFRSYCSKFTLKFKSVQHRTSTSTIFYMELPPYSTISHGVITK